MNKKAVSLMVSFVILVSIVLASAMAAYAFLKNYPDIIKEKVDCKEGTSLVIDEYICLDGEFKIKIRNNGLFKVNGFKMYVSYDEFKEPTEILKTESQDSDNYYFYILDKQKGLMPQNTGGFENSRDITFQVLNQPEILKLQPVILDENNYLIVCENAIIKQEINC